VILTGRERYSWLVPVGLRSSAHAFVPGARHSLCLKVERYGVGHHGWQVEDVLPNEPKRARCPQCQRIVTRNPGMGEVDEQ
jgi:hypothetical protein